MKDSSVRAIKTFVQAFLGIFIPELVLILSGSLPADLSGWNGVLAPVACSALAAAISKTWNVINEMIEEEMRGKD